jgi:hypothetical protein
MHHSHLWGQETHACDLSYEAGPLQPLVEQWLMERSDLTAAFEVRTIETDQIAVLGKGGRKGFATAHVPAIHQLLIEGADGRFGIGLR